MLKKTVFLSKLRHSDPPRLQYWLEDLCLNEFLGKPLSITFSGRIQCVSCGRAIKKTFSDGHCFPCAQKLASCDLCSVKPELCHFHKGTCREPEWGAEHCLIQHVVYLSNTSGLKVGITRAHKVLERWGDQGASAAIVLAIVPERLVAGTVEVALKKILNDKTDWRALITGVRQEVDLPAERARIGEALPAALKEYLVSGEEYDRLHEFEYPVIKYPAKALTHDPLKTPTISGDFEGIKGQYLFVGGKAVNVRKYTGYEATFEF